MEIERSERPRSAGLLQQFRQELAAGDAVSALQAGLIGKGARIEGPFGARDLRLCRLCRLGPGADAGRALHPRRGAALLRQQPHRGFLLRRLHDPPAPRGARGDRRLLRGGTGARRHLRRFGRDRRHQSPRQACSASPTPSPPAGGSVSSSAPMSIIPTSCRGAKAGPRWSRSPRMPAAARTSPHSTPPCSGTADLTVCAFSAASNVTGIVTDVAAVTRKVKAAGARMVWDYAGAGPYLPIAMSPDDGVEIDAVGRLAAQVHRWPRRLRRADRAPRRGG